MSDEEMQALVAQLPKDVQRSIRLGMIWREAAMKKDDKISLQAIARAEAHRRALFPPVPDDDLFVVLS